MTRWFSGCFGFALAVAYCPVIIGGTATPRWLLIAAVVPIALIVAEVAGRSIEITWAHVIGAMFLGWAALSLLWSANHYDSVDALWRLALLAGCFAIGSVIDDARPLLVGMMFGLGVSSGLVLVEAGTGWALPAATPMAGLFGNRNYLGEATALVFIGLISIEVQPFLHRLTWWRFWVLLGCLGPALAFTHARGALVAIGVAIFGMLWHYRLRWVAILLAVLAVEIAGVVFWIWPNYGSIVDRFNIWRDAVHGLSLFGSGFGTFGATIAAHAIHIDPAAVRDTHAHNDLLEVAYELGLPGALLALAFVVSVLRSDRMERFVFLALIVEGMFAFPSFLPLTGALGLFAAGVASRGLKKVQL